MTAMRNIPIALPCTGVEEWQACREPLVGGWLTQGPRVEAFEKAFAARHGAQCALATTSCTTSLHLILAALGIGPGDEVIVPAFTWIATANVVVYCGATPVFVDVDRSTYNIDVKEVERKVSKRTKAIIAVHLFGLTADMDELSRVAPGVPVIEDAACAAGSSYRGRSAGSLGAAAAFSFHPRKSITTGEGGMVTTNDATLAETANMLRNHGAAVSEEQRHAGDRPYLLPAFNMLGFNYRMTDIQAAVGLVQLAKLDSFIRERQQWADFYEKELAGVDWLRTPSVPPGQTHAWQAYVCYVNESRAPMPRNKIMERLKQEGISTRPGTHAVHMLGYYSQRFGLKADDFPAARDCDRHSMAIPLHNRITEEDYHYIAQVIRSL